MLHKFCQSLVQKDMVILEEYTYTIWKTQETDAARETIGIALNSQFLKFMKVLLSGWQNRSLQECSW